jgi:hypothetical protein
MQMSEQTLCGCGCNTAMLRFDARHRERKFILGHNLKNSSKPFAKGSTPWNKDMKGIRLSPSTEFKKGRQVSVATQFKIGMTPWNIGRACDESTKQKLSLANRAVKVSNFDGYVTNSTLHERLTFRAKMQKEILKRDNYTCQLCQVQGGWLQVDHIKSWAEYPDLRFDENNCRTLCMGCHYFITFKRKLPEGVTWGHNLNKRRISS